MMLRDGADIQPFNRLIGELRDSGIRDLLGEGIRPENVECTVELELSQPAGPNVQVKCPQLHLASMDDLRRSLSSNLPSDGICLEMVRVRVKKAMSKPALVLQELGGRDAAAAFLSKREVAYGSSAGEANLYKWESLRPGNKVQGCSVLESAYSTYFVPGGWSLEIDRYGNAQLMRTSVQENSTSAYLQGIRSYGSRR